MILVGAGEWDGLLDWLRDPVLAGRRIDRGDLAGLRLVADPDEVVKIVTAAHQNQRAQAQHQRRHR